MKYCLRSRLESAYVIKADEIKVDFRDRASIPDLIEKYPNKTIILMCYTGEEIDWALCGKWKILARDKFIMCVSSIDDATICKEKGFKFYFGYPVKTFYELNAMKDLGVCYVRLGEPLFFQMEEVKKVGLPIRAVPNVAYIDMVPHKDGVCGTWIRPEDMHAYEDYVDIIEFEDCDVKKEQALFRIYAEQRNWPGETRMLISNFDYDGLNRIVVPDVVEKRLKCGQRCQMGSHCRLCYRAFDLANQEKTKAYAEQTIKP